MAGHSNDDVPRDLLGREMTGAEQALLDLYHRVTELLDLDFSPTAEANVKEAAASLWQAVNNLALTDERPTL